MKRVFLLQDIVPSYRVPVFRRLAAAPGVDLTVFYSRPTCAMHDEGLRNAAEMNGFRTVQLQLLEVGRGAWQPGIFWRVLRDRPEVLIAGRAGRVDVMFTFLLGKLLGVRVLWFLGGVPYTDPVRIREYADRGRLRRWFGRRNLRDWLIRTADGVIVYSEHARRFYEAEGVQARRLWVAPNSPDTEALKAYGREWGQLPDLLAAERRRLCPAGQPLLFLLGRLNPARKVDTLLRALARVRSAGLACSLVIVGEGSERSALAALAASLSLTDVHFDGSIYDERELARYFLICDAFVTPGVASMAIKMAMTFGKPVITVNYGLEVHDIVDGVNGFTFRMDDDDQLATRIRQVLESRERRGAMGLEALRTVRERVNIKNMITGFQRAIDDVADVEARGSGAEPSRRA